MQGGGTQGHHALQDALDNHNKHKLRHTRVDRTSEVIVLVETKEQSVTVAHPVHAGRFRFFGRLEVDNILECIDVYRRFVGIRYFCIAKTGLVFRVVGVRAVVGFAPLLFGSPRAAIQREIETTRQEGSHHTLMTSWSAPKLREIGLKTDEAKSSNSREWKTEWEHETFQHKENLVVLGTQATERNSMTVDDSDMSLAKGRLNKAILLAEQVEKIKGLKMDTTKTGALWLITSTLTPGE